MTDFFGPAKQQQLSIIYCLTHSKFNLIRDAWEAKLPTGHVQIFQKDL